MNKVSSNAIQAQGYYSVSAHWKAIFSRPARKVPLDAGFTCPNRDGTVSAGGCSFCNAQGSGTGLHGVMSLTGQWEHWRERRRAVWGEVALVGYLQAFSNTHGPASRLRAVLEELATIPDLDGLCLGTRPDCLDGEKIRLLADFPARELWLELGLQSSNPATLARVNRGHGPDSFVRAVELAVGMGLKVLAHVMAGLPGETPEDWDQTVRFVNRLPVAGIKFHNLFVAENTPLAQEYREGLVQPPTLEDYAAWVGRSLAALRPDVVVHRLAADPAHGELITPVWAGDKRAVHNAILAEIRRGGIRQGMAWNGPPT